MLAAARFGDEITHTEQRTGLIGGMVIGALVGAALVAGTIATVLTGGLALAPILLIVGAVATGAAVGGGIFSLLGGMSSVPKGAINKAATTVFVNGILAARSCIDTALCQDHTLQAIMSGAASVYVEGFPFARVSDIGMCSFKISKGSPNVFVSEPTAACPGYENIKPEVEPWLTNLHAVLGLVGSFCLGYGALGWAGSALSTGLGFGGSILGSELGGKYFGKWGAIGGGILGGILGGGLGAGISRGLGNAGIRGFQPTPRVASFNNFSNSVKEFEGNPALAREAHDLYSQQKWGELEELMNKNNINGGFPPNDGFISSRTTTLRPGTKIDRYGGFYKDGEFVDQGKFVSPKGASFESRALPESYQNTKPFTSYEVLKPIPSVQEGQAIPWFGQEGMGTQYKIPQANGIQDLLDGKYIKKLP